MYMHMARNLITSSFSGWMTYLPTHRHTSRGMSDNMWYKRGAYASQSQSDVNFRGGRVGVPHAILLPEDMHGGTFGTLQYVSGRQRQHRHTTAKRSVLYSTCWTVETGVVVLCRCAFASWFVQVCPTSCCDTMWCGHQYVSRDEGAQVQKSLVPCWNENSQWLTTCMCAWRNMGRLTAVNVSVQLVSGQMHTADIFEHFFMD